MFVIARNYLIPYSSSINGLAISFSINSNLIFFFLLLILFYETFIATFKT